MITARHYVTKSLRALRPLTERPASPVIARSARASPLLRSRATSARTFVTSLPRQAQPPPPPPTSTLSHDEYEHVSERDMETLNESLEIFCEDFGNGNWEIEYSSGVLNLTLPPYGTYVLNKQPPNLQIWMSSPVSGPSRFEYVNDSWVHHRKEGVKLGELLSGELKEILEKSGNEAAAGDWEGVGLP
ncbi:iron donor protein CyaY [Cryptococcus neoformans]|nr:iron donor protein CyaY [Cryptococcus neoformans var. grubii c45]OWZ73088.1 iron donor protein CyaY [Cryptococcus neoformans var. grubii]OXB38064.1 iron donor protein CyaY [Cryptococcus neoformans var. grubii]OXC62379.1 iron donor protein CyaY [Cryptococcus neoformans var. grubii MW-RSA852]